MVREHTVRVGRGNNTPEQIYSDVVLSPAGREILKRQIERRNRRWNRDHADRLEKARGMACVSRFEWTDLED
jgi:hypothetical protein